LGLECRTNNSLKLREDVQDGQTRWDLPFGAAQGRRHLPCRQQAEAEDLWQPVLGKQGQGGLCFKLPSETRCGDCMC